MQRASQKILATSILGRRCFDYVAHYCFAVLYEGIVLTRVKQNPPNV
jgi:hypothetical protein